MDTVHVKSMGMTPSTFAKSTASSYNATWFYPFLSVVGEERLYVRDR